MHEGIDENINVERRALIRKVGLGVGAGALALAAIKPTLAETVLTDTYIETGETKERLSKSVTVVVGKTGAVDYLTTDYGSDDACIQAAIDYVEGVGGGSVLVREGTYTIEATLTINDNVLVCGVGYKTILKANTNLNDNLIENTDSVGGNSSITIEKMLLDGNKANQSSGSNHCIFFDNVDTFLISDVLTKDCYGSDGIYIDNCNNIIVKNIYASGGDGAAVGLESTNYGLISSVIGNAGVELIDLNYDVKYISISDCTGYNQTGNGIDINGCENNVISNCVIIGAPEGITISGAAKGADDNSYRNIVHNCIIKDCTTHGIRVMPDSGLSNSKYNSIIGNIVENTTGHGIIIEGTHNKCVGNTIKGSSASGIICSSDYNIFNDNISIDNGERGIIIYGGTYCIVEGNLIENNTLDGVRLTSNNNSVIGNIIEGNGAYGINEAAGDNSNITNNQVRNNSSGQIVKSGSGTVVYNNPGFNPVGPVGPPSVPASTVNYTNVYGYPCTVVVSGGTVTEIDIDDIATGLTSGIFIIPPGGTINITHSVAPSWLWWGL